MEKKDWFNSKLESIRGDKVMWIIVIVLYLVSILAIFSSTSLEPSVLKGTKTRLDIVREQLFVVGGCFLLTFMLYKVNKIWWFRMLGMVSFWISFALLIMLAAHIKLKGFVQAEEVNGAWRTLKVLGFQVHVFEVVKILMVLYLAWAVNAWRTDGFPLMNYLGRRTGKKLFVNKWFQSLVFIFIPIALCSMLIMTGGMSSMLFITAMMFLTIIIGGLSLKHTAVYVLIAAGLVAGAYGLWKASPDGSFIHEKLIRFATLESRVKDFGNKELSFDEKLAELGPRTKAGAEFIDYKRQEIGSRIAIHEGGIFGKLPGNSTQKYRVPLIFGDYMYSFIIEEYGLIGGILIMLLFLSLLARGALVTMHCENIFARTAVGGLTLTISCQAMAHIVINVGLIPATGQTLPMISDGKSSMIMFSIAFGIILSISKMVAKKIEEERLAEEARLAAERAAGEWVSTGSTATAGGYGDAGSEEEEDNGD